MAFLIKVFVIASLFFLLLIPSPANALETKTSPKKGAGFSISPLVACNSQDFNNSCVSGFLQKYRSLGLSWLYNWGIGKPGWIDSTIQYSPMVWGKGTGANGSYTATDLAPIKSFAAQYPGSYWLIWNEPDLDSQSNIRAVSAAALYKPLRDSILQSDPSAKFIVGNVAYMDSAWIDAFRTEYKRINGSFPEVNGWGMHHYAGGDYNSTNWRNTMQNIRNWLVNIGQGSKEFWLTEFGSLQSNATGLQIMKDQLEWIESQTWITRYAWYWMATESKFQGNLFTGNLAQNTFNLNELGREYAIHPINGSALPSPSPAPSPTSSVCGSTLNSACCATHTCQSSLGLYCFNETCSKVADKNSGIAEWSTAFNVYNQSLDFNNDNKIDGVDYVFWLREGKSL